MRFGSAQDSVYIFDISPYNSLIDIIDTKHIYLGKISEAIKKRRNKVLFVASKAILIWNQTLSSDDAYSHDKNFVNSPFKILKKWR